MDAAEFIYPNDPHVAWSIMIVLYPYITGLVAGAFVVSSLYHVFDQQVLKPVARLALVTALCFCMFATLPLLLHLHHPERAFNIMITPNATSAMAGFGFIYSFYMLLLVIEVWLVFRPDIVERVNTNHGIRRWVYLVLSLGVPRITEQSLKIDRRLIRILAVVGIPAACVLHGYVGFLFGAVKANPWWSTALMPVIFLISAVLSGIAVLLALYVFICWRHQVAPEIECLRTLVRYLWIALITAFSLEALELIHMGYEAGSEWHILRTLLTEKLAVSYVLVQVIVGSLVPLVLLSVAVIAKPSRRMTVWIACIAAVLILVQVFAMRWNVVIGGQLFSKSFRGFVEYRISWFGREGILAAAVVLMLPFIALYGANRVLPISTADDH
ncbi:MAG: polysulfide reductase NrfD [Planctomycetaceae bacterium]|jgi:Ni/Fe-hydrogenase subunit HybB-like protein|nr:polysulfide reductase NrfD [Planctomycetaceae bacterium]MBT4724681.1 polysulfide reductase NrfD [Planctomycetaceae bacterium]MBT5123968.1 polysulfide reductase NrfD [Planctomycetaceae bacterium]MBT5597046.1 polysulfide reductase NrfD [Planctomycetaceae bacterium]MBT5885516.1 polysulfide reductase NrfD [Planctomycetaceae bacterium]